MKDKLNYNLEWSDYFKLDETSPSGLSRIRNRVGKSIQPYYIGTRCFKRSGRPQGWMVNFQKSSYCIHRIIWVLAHGVIDQEKVVDHLDGDPFNNKMENLSLKTTADNLKNQRKHSNNTSGNTGVSLYTKPGHMYYRARWNDINGIQHQKNFSVTKFGQELAEDMAIAYRKEQICRLIEEGALYTDRHGTSE